jgi:hypothetical protein
MQRWELDVAGGLLDATPTTLPSTAIRGRRLHSIRAFIVGNLSGTPLAKSGMSPSEESRLHASHSEL